MIWKVRGAAEPIRWAFEVRCGWLVGLGRAHKPGISLDMVGFWNERGAWRPSRGSSATATDREYIRERI